MSSRARPSSEPSFIAMIVDAVKETKLHLNTTPAQAVIDVYQILGLVEPAKKESIEDYKPLMEETLKLINERMGVWSASDLKYQQLQKEFDDKNWMVYHLLYSRAVAILHLCGYFKWDTFTGFHDPSGGRKSSDDVKYATRRNL